MPVSVEGPRRTSPGTNEFARKMIHMATSLGGAAVAFLLPDPVARTLLVGALAVALVVDWARLRSRTVRSLFARTVGPMVRPREARRFTGATTLAAGFAVTALLFPLPLAATAYLYAGLSDTASTLVGRRWGRHRTPWGKSLEGSAAFFVTSLVVAALVPAVGPAAGLAAAVVTTLVEAGPFDDNLWVAPTAAATLWLAGAG